MTTSNIQPQNIIPDFGTLKNGTLDIIVTWDASSETVENEMGNKYTQWNYESARLNWILPAGYSTQEDIQDYFDNNYSSGEKILDWAKASKISQSSIS